MTIQVKSDAEPIEIEADAYLPTEYGNFRVSVTLDEAGKEHSLLYTGDLSLSLIHISEPTRPY